MKKIYSLVSATLATASLYAQFTVVDFEEFTLPQADTFYVGADGAGGFTSQDVLFKNNYEEFSWGYVWGGFAYSNMTDNTTPGFGNQFSVITGSGADNSEIYAVYTNSDTLFFPYLADFGTVQITNTTYAYYAVKDGDDGNATPFVKGPFEEGDFFSVTIYGHAMNDDLIDSTVIYLANYLSADPTEHYVLDEWTSFNLSALNGSHYLTFRIKSSDVGPWGMNTPAYFALDNLEFATLINSVQTHQEILVDVYPNPTRDVLTISSCEEMSITLYNSIGKLAKQAHISLTGTIDISDLEAGVYLLQINSLNGSTTRRIVKQ
jgi:hypothetical protein